MIFCFPGSNVKAAFKVAFTCFAIKRISAGNFVGGQVLRICRTTDLLFYQEIKL